MKMFLDLIDLKLPELQLPTHEDVLIVGGIVFVGWFVFVHIYFLYKRYDYVSEIKNMLEGDNSKSSFEKEDIIIEKLIFQGIKMSGFFKYTYMYMNNDSRIIKQEIRVSLFGYSLICT